MQEHFKQNDIRDDFFTAHSVFFQDALISYCCTLIAEVAEPLLSRVT